MFDGRHSMMCNVPNAGGCYVPSCSCACHKEPLSEVSATRVPLVPVVVDADVRERWWHKVDRGRRQTTNMVAVLDEHDCVSVSQEVFSRLMEDAGWTPGKAGPDV